MKTQPERISRFFCSTCPTSQLATLSQRQISQEKETPPTTRALWPPAAATRRRLPLVGLQGKQWADGWVLSHLPPQTGWFSLVIFPFEEIGCREIVFDGLPAAWDGSIFSIIHFLNPFYVHFSSSSLGCYLRFNSISVCWVPGIHWLADRLARTT